MAKKAVEASSRPGRVYVSAAVKTGGEQASDDDDDSFFPTCTHAEDFPFFRV